jgi:hypothetical protein
LIGDSVSLPSRQPIGMMTMPTPPVIDIQGGKVTVETSYLAARLDLSVNRLREEMRHRVGFVVDHNVAAATETANWVTARGTIFAPAPRSCGQD